MQQRETPRFDLPDASGIEPALKLDCRRYRGDRPCAGGVQGVCPPACREYSPMGHRILVIKLAALGDVLRTTALLPGLKEAWPNSHVTWVTRPAGARLLANNPLIDRLLPFDADALCHLECERFDLCLSLDKEAAPAALAMRVNAAERRGMGLSRFGAVFPLNAECRPYFRLGLDDELKFRHNDKTYQQLIYEAVGLPYAGQRYRLYPGSDSRRRAEQRWSALGVEPEEIVIGLNTGAGAVFANKTWPAEKFAHLAEALVTRHGWRVALLGGPRESELKRRIADACRGVRTRVRERVVPGVVDPCGDNQGPGAPPSELDFAALLARCRVVVTGDTMAMHVAIAGDVPCVVLFGPTCAQEVDLYGRGTKVRTALPCSPCYRRSCERSPNCMDDVSLARVQRAVEQWAGAACGTALPVVPVGA